MGRLLILIYPFAELWSLIELGVRYGAGIAVLWVLGAIAAGMVLLRVVGRVALTHLAAAQREGRLSERLLVDDLSLAFVAVLLMIPGLVSDVMALLLALSPLRRWLFRLMSARHVEPNTHFSSGFTAHREDIIEGEFEDLSQTERTGRPASQLPVEPNGERRASRLDPRKPSRPSIFRLFALKSPVFSLFLALSLAEC